jgi:hypothetical protein
MELIGYESITTRNYDCVFVYSRLSYPVCNAHAQSGSTEFQNIISQTANFSKKKLTLE